MSDGNDIVQNLADTITFKKQRDDLANAVSKARSFLGMGQATNAAKPDQSWHNQMVSKANQSFAAQQQPKSSTKTPTPKSAPNQRPSYKHGTDYVPKTGPANLHKGEAVLKKEDADKYREAKSMATHKAYDVSEELGGKKEEKPKKEIAHIKTRKGKSGGYIHTHVHTHPEHHPDEEHVSPDQDAMASHMLEHLGEPNDGEAEADGGDSGVPQQAGGPQQAAPPPPQQMGM